MRFVLTILFFGLFVTTAVGQISDRKMDSVESKQDSANRVVNKFSGRPNVAIDSVKSGLTKVDCIVSSKSLEQRVSQPLDSAKYKLSGLLLQGKKITSDSLSSINPAKDLDLAINSVQHTLDSTAARISEIVSISRPDSTTSNLKNNIEDSVNLVQRKLSKVGSLGGERSKEVLKTIDAETKGLGNTNGLSQLNPVNQLSDINPSAESLPKLDLQNGPTPIIDHPGRIVDIEIINPDLSIPGIPELESIQPDISTTVPSLPNDVGNMDVPGLPEVEQVSELSNFTAVQEITGGYENLPSKVDTLQAKTLIENAPEKLVNERIVGSEVTDQLGEGDSFVANTETKIKSYKNPEAFKKQTLERSKAKVAAMLASNTASLEETIGKVSAYQRKMGTLPLKKSDLPKKRDPLRKLKPMERLVIGLTLQIQKPPGVWLVDVNPSLRYRITSYWSIGGGWNERIWFRDVELPEQSHFSGPRIFSEVVVFKGFSFRLETESMNTYVPTGVSTNDVRNHAWIYSYYLGVKKDFTFVKSILGNAQFMYAIHRSEQFNPYPTRFNVRFGFEYMTQNKKKNKNRN